MSSFKIPSLKELKEQAISEINANLPDADANLKASIYNVLSNVISGQTYGLYGYLKWISNQIFIQDCDEEALISHGLIWNISRKLPSFANGKVLFSGLLGSSIPKGTRIKRTDDIYYTTTSSVIIPENGEIEVTVISENTGTINNADKSTKLSLSSPISGVNTNCYVSELGISGGAEIENIEDYRARILERIRNPPRGGAKNDYIRWAFEVAGVSRAWCYPNEMGLGTVTIRFMMDEVYDDGIPRSGDIETVKNYISDDERKPITAELFVVAPIIENITIEIDDLYPNTLEIRNLITTELKALFKRETYPACTLYFTKLINAIGSISGIERYNLKTPSSDMSFSTGVIPVLETIIFNGGS